MNQREIKQSIKDNPNLTATEKIQKLNEVRAPYKEMTDEELLQLVRDFTEENGREPMQADVLYDRELKQRFGPWNRMLERAGTRPVPTDLKHSIVIFYYTRKVALPPFLLADLSFQIK